MALDSEQQSPVLVEAAGMDESVQEVDAKFVRATGTFPFYDKGLQRMFGKKRISSQNGEKIYNLAPAFNGFGQFGYYLQTDKKLYYHLCEAPADLHIKFTPTVNLGVDRNNNTLDIFGKNTTGYPLMDNTVSCVFDFPPVPPPAILFEATGYTGSTPPSAASIFLYCQTAGGASFQVTWWDGSVEVLTSGHATSKANPGGALRWVSIAALSGDHINYWSADASTVQIDVSGVTGLETLNIPDGNLTTLDVSNQLGLTYLDCHDNLLTSLILPPAPNNISYLAAFWNNFNTAQVDAAINAMNPLIAFGEIDVFQSRTGHPSVPPSGASAANKAALLANHWTVSTD